MSELNKPSIKRLAGKKCDPLKSERGLTMVELLIVIGIIAGIVAFIFIKSMTVRSDVKSSKTVDAINMIYQGVDSMFANSGGDYSTIANNDIVTLAPKNMIYSNGGNSIIGTPWYNSNNNSTITVAPTGTNNTQFTLTLNEIPNDNCRTIGSQFLNGVAAAVSANSNVVQNATALNTACDGGSGGNSNLALTFN
ncbi:type 4 pilus major pilin [Fangia hongkongensis]|uniref:type 4 pilus major pilin n=1 Tax=Fangia hongkongensis TaxID=270495 RepID=UPI00036BACE1|nr:type 4 pilus major pilin [Fangia hongkongensis]MBK2124448.1 hypothetical protein [Fangia hongkongensis]